VKIMRREGKVLLLCDGSTLLYKKSFGSGRCELPDGGRARSPRRSSTYRVRAALASHVQAFPG